MTSRPALFKEPSWSKADPERWMAWLLSFCKQDLRRLNREDWTSLLQDIHELCRSSAPFDPAQLWQQPLVVGHPQAYVDFYKRVLTGLRTRADILKMQQTLRDGFAQLFPKQLPVNHEEARRIWQFPVSIPAVCLTRHSLMDKQRLKNKKSQFTKNSVFVPKLHFYAKWPALFWLAVAQIIEQCGPRLRQCEECHALFLRKMRQTFCSGACSQKARSRKWYIKHGEEVRKKRRQTSGEKTHMLTRTPDLRVDRIVES